MRILAIVDLKSKDYSSILGCLEGLKAQFLDVVTVTWVFEYRNLSNLPWSEYSPTDYGVSFSCIEKDTKAIFDRDGYLYDTVVYFIDKAHWKANMIKKVDAPQIRGWNLGRFFNNYQVQLLETNDVLANMQYRINEEVAHSIDDFAERELGKSLDRELGLDYDEDIVHDRNNTDGVRGDYRTFYIRHPKLIQDIITTRQKKALASLIAKIGVLLRDLLMRRSKPRPTTDYHSH